MAFVNPEEIIKKHFNLQPGMAVADFGAGSGYYTLAAAEIVGDSGVVYAVDIQKDLLEKIKSRAEDEGLKTVEIVWADLDKPEGSRIAENSLDFVIISNVLFQAENKAALATEAFRVLKSGGIAGVIDWSESFGGLGPRPEDVLSKQDCEKLFLEAGFTVEKDFEAGEHHYGFLFKKPQ
ncbi:MAG: class I SAM-dependent methyltransferase [bacterium]|nr:class I SAM-dependent methyltransferase [bacterium]